MYLKYTTFKSFGIKNLKSAILLWFQNLEGSNEERVNVEWDGSIHEVHHAHTLDQKELVPTKDDRLVCDLWNNTL